MVSSQERLKQIEEMARIMSKGELLPHQKNMLELIDHVSNGAKVVCCPRNHGRAYSRKIFKELTEGQNKTYNRIINSQK